VQKSGALPSPFRRDRPVRAAATVRGRLRVTVLSELPEVGETSSIVAVWASVRYTCFYEAPGSIRAHAARLFLGASANAPDRCFSSPTTEPDVHSSFASHADGRASLPA
jgi:hypothetical protein